MSRRPETAAPTLDASTVDAWRAVLASTVMSADPGARDDGRGGAGSDERRATVDLLASLEALKSAASAAQARLALRLDRAQRAADAAAGVPTERRGAGVSAQVALARGESPHRGRALLGAARAWADELPHTFAALREGALSEFRALLVVQHTAHLPVEAREEVDRVVCSDRRALAGLGTRRLVALVRGHGARLDPAAATARARRAESERAVSLRPAPDTMTYLTALLPVAQGVAAYAALRRAADGARATGDPRSAGQVMADTLVTRLTGQADADAVPVSVNLVVSDATLLGAGSEPGHVDGHGPVPAQVARELVARGIDTDAAWLRRVYANPTGELVALTSSSRFHPPGLAAFLRVRDQGICRTPYCDAPIRHLDHVREAAAGGATDSENAQGLCEACNHLKQSSGWTQRAARDPGGRHRVVTTTPTGHRYARQRPSHRVRRRPGATRIGPERPSRRSTTPSPRWS